ncbi:hypothetical protein BGZ63DRAFT_389847 [Mariannaea sp. PMI_226]|nr:hypothetical protein BGZ63DRAFT_389847 [Mariannaea sp. PMI_226]
MDEGTRYQVAGARATKCRKWMNGQERAALPYSRTQGHKLHCLDRLSHLADSQPGPSDRRSKVSASPSPACHCPALPSIGIHGFSQVPLDGGQHILLPSSHILTVKTRLAELSHYHTAKSRAQQQSLDSATSTFKLPPQMCNQKDSLPRAACQYAQLR